MLTYGISSKILTGRFFLFSAYLLVTLENAIV
ncbi:MAG: hypothetical protein FD170_1252 [Bacteroidetes bacterium]|nr:MAG: hypothetical protein FD170_1252 [Bacteroidota bacterium]